MTVPTITTLPDFPTRGEDPTTFAQKANDSVAAYPTMVTQMNTMGQFVEDEAAAAEASRIAAETAESNAEAQVALAEAAADAAESASNATQWVSGQAYVTGAVVWSPINFLSYRANTNTSGTTDPSLSASWTALGVPLPVSVANGGTGITSFGTGVATALGQNVTGSGGIVLGTGGTVSGLVLNDGYTEEVYALGTSGALTLEPDNGSIQTCALTGNPTFSDGLSAGQSIVLMLTNGASYTVTWPTMTWVTSAGNAAPTLTAADTLVFWKVSTTLYGAYVGSYV